MSYKPATAIISASIDRSALGASDELDEAMLISSDDIPELLTVVADLIGARAKKRAGRARVLRGH